MTTLARFLMFLAFSSALRVGMGFDEEGESEEREKVKEDIFVMGEPKHVVKTEAGNMKVFKGFRGKISERPMHIGFITMEPKSLFIPQYMDSTLILFIRRGIFCPAVSLFLSCFHAETFFFTISHRGSLSLSLSLMISCGKVPWDS